MFTYGQKYANRNRILLNLPEFPCADNCENSPYEQDYPFDKSFAEKYFIKLKSLYLGRALPLLHG